VGGGGGERERERESVCVCVDGLGGGGRGAPTYVWLPPGECPPRVFESPNIPTRTEPTADTLREASVHVAKT